MQLRTACTAFCVVVAGIPGRVLVWVISAESFKKNSSSYVAGNGSSPISVKYCYDNWQGATRKKDNAKHLHIYYAQIMRLACGV